MIEVKNVTKRYGDFYAVRNVNFEVKDGEIVGFLGRNGAGKTTTMNVITGFIEPTGGDVVVNGYSITENPKQVKSQIGYMPEGTPLYADLTVKEFIGYMADLKLIPKKKRKEAVEKAILETGLDKVKNNLTRNLSRGYKQRVSMAGAIVGDPKILILDEPTVGLDPKQVIEIRELIKNFGKEHTVLISSHILSEISQISDKVVIIDKGEIVAVDTPKNLETKTEDKSLIEVIVDDSNNKINALKDDIKAITDIKYVEDIEETKKYVIETTPNADIRKELFEACSKYGILLLESKKVESSLEDAFIKLVEDRPEFSQTEIRKMQYDKEIEELRKEDEENKKEKAEFKQALKEEKARKKAAKESKASSDSKENKTKKATKTTKDSKKDSKTDKKEKGGNK